MGQLHRLVICGLTIIFLGLLVGATTMAQGSCSLTVRVVSPDGRRPEAPISVREHDGRTVEKEQVPGKGDVQFCDLGILPVTVIVGSDGLCNQVTVRDVPLAWDQPYKLTVTYDPEACSISHRIPMPIPQCELLFRVSDSEGRWLPGVRLTMKASFAVVTGGEMRSSPRQAEDTADRYGRARFLPARGSSIRGTASGDGFKPSDFEFTCSEKWQEQLIRLEKR